MKSIKPGDKIVCIKKTPHPGILGNVLKVKGVNKKTQPPVVYAIRGEEPLWFIRDEICLTPHPDQKFEVGDWVMPVALAGCDLDGNRESLLKPYEIKEENGNNLWWDGNNYWFSKQLALICRDGDHYVIGDSCRITADVFMERYGCDPIPETVVSHNCEAYQNDHTSPSSEPARESAWPTPKDIEECCGFYKCKSLKPGSFSIAHVTPDILRNHGNRAYFDKWSKKQEERIEPIPPQCVPGYDDPEKPDWKAEAVAKYPRVTEED